MKYLKTYEKMLKNTDKRIENNPLNFFSGRILKLLKEISSPFGYSVRRFFFDNNNISIICKIDNDNFQLLKITFMIRDNNVIMVVKKNGKRMMEIFDFIKTTLNNYINRDFGDTISYIFSLSELDDIIEKVEEYYLYLNQKKYNI